ncbi:MAG: hypothetical protein ACNA7W_14750 [Pseudomonadales bacterium]
MKLVQIHVHFEYTAAIDALLDRHAVVEAVCYPSMEGRDRDGKHHGSQIFPGNVTVFQVLLPATAVDALFVDLERFRRHKTAHHHLQALVLPVERRLVDEAPAPVDRETSRS